MSYADGIFDPRFNRYVTVREGRLSGFCSSLKADVRVIYFLLYEKHLFIYVYLADRRQDALNSTTEIVAIALNGQNIQGEISEKAVDNCFFHVKICWTYEHPTLLQLKKNPPLRLV